ncbi:MAG TPA: dethiobiotin synthase [Steroidobacteraceae bacterium]|nr:dethiobiotin synthase [Steroidobacteraceae bacterium]
MMRAYFVTGTDTGVGKTLVTAALLRRLRSAGVRVAGMKPVAAGAIDGPEGRANEDALLLQAESSARHPYALVNPCLYEPAIAPHIAAAESGVAIDVDRIAAALRALASSADVVLVEGAGGFLVPMDDARSCAELPVLLGMDVILVVGLRLGCLNHALLTAEAAAARGLRLAGWVGNCVVPEFPRREANVATLESRLPAPCLGIVPWLHDRDLARAAVALSGTLWLRPA